MSLSVNAFAHNAVGTDDCVLMKIDGKEVYLSEFDYFYNNAASRLDCSKDEYFHYFLRYKMKVYDAKRLGLDKNIDYGQRVRQLKSAISSYDASECAPDENSGNNLFKVLTYRIGQNEDLENAISFMRGIFSQLKSGTTLGEICSSYSDMNLRLDEFTDLNYCLNEVRNELLKVSEGEFSSPFVSPEGVHIVIKGDSVGAGCVISDFVGDVLLASEWDSCRPDNSKEFSENELENYFKANKKKYMWELPHYRGVVVHCKDKKSALKIKRKLRKLPFQEWSERLKALSQEDARFDAIVQSGLFRIGENEYIDKLVFKCGSFNPVEGYPYTFVVGKCLDCMPGSYKDVYDVLLEDFIQEKEKQYFEALETELRVEKYIDVLKTVNSGGSN